MSSVDNRRSMGHYSYARQQYWELGCFIRIEQLLIVSGLTDIFSIQGDVSAYNNWSLFTIEYPGDWIGMRYKEDIAKKFSEQKVKELYKNLYDYEYSIIKTMSRKRRW